MAYAFKSSVHACDLDGTLVLLDVSADRYTAVGGPTRLVCLDLLNGRPPAQRDLPLIASLVARGILTDREIDGGKVLAPVAERATVSLRGRSDVTTKSPVGALLRLLFHMAGLRFGTLSRSLARLAERRVGRGDLRYDERRTISIAMSFVAAERFVSARRRCLPRSIALSHALLSARLPANVVIGVKMNPFEAHCWVQHGDRLISDELEAIAPYTPIFVL